MAIGRAHVARADAEDALSRQVELQVSEIVAIETDPIELLADRLVADVYKVGMAPRQAADLVPGGLTSQ